MLLFLWFFVGVAPIFTKAEFYNRTVFDYNTRVHTVPLVVIARTFDFPPADFSEADVRSEVRVRFDHAAAIAERPAAPPVA